MADGLNRLASIGGVSTAHDQRGNVTTDPITAKSYGYSSANLLTSSTGGTAATLTYDPLMRLYQVAAGATARFQYDGLNMIAEYDGSTLQRRFVFGPGVDEPLVQYEGSGTSNRRFLHADERGSIVAISDGSGNLLTGNRYDEYGKPQAGNSGRFQYTGQMWLPEIGAYYYKARIYSPTFGGRFLQTDPIGVEGGINLYGYVGNDPVNLTDPLGLLTVICADGTRASSVEGCAGHGGLAPTSGGPTPGATPGSVSNNANDCQPPGCYVNLPNGSNVWVSVTHVSLGSGFVINGLTVSDLTWEALESAAQASQCKMQVYQAGGGVTAAVFGGANVSINFGIAVPEKGFGLQAFVSPQISFMGGVGAFLGAGLSGSYGENRGSISSGLDGFLYGEAESDGAVRLA